ncbi:MAG: hypothetical protein LBG17_03255 [Bacteroidales bacterium]|nr:hypothetical protein [Bacteroidales bacterium]
MTAIILTIILSLFSPSAQQSDGTLNKQKCIPAALIMGIASLVMSGVSTAAGAAKAKAAEREHKNLINTEQGKIDRELEKGYMNTAEAQAAANQAKEDIEEQEKRNEARLAMSGGTHEARLASRNVANKAYANTLRGIASGANNWRNTLENRRMGLISNQQAFLAQKQQQASNQVASGVNGMVNSAAGIAIGATAPSGANKAPSSSLPQSPNNNYIWQNYMRNNYKGLYGNG